MRETVTRVATLGLPKAFPWSQKKYLIGSRSDLRVPYREITLSPTHHSRGTEENPPLPVYDSSGPFSDPDCSVDIVEGLPKLRSNWIEERSDTELLHGLSSEFGRQRASDLLTFELRFPTRPRPRRALRGRNVTQMHPLWISPPQSRSAKPVNGFCATNQTESLCTISRMDLLISNDD
jgi:phosphomethylpyrimidine synthase